MNQQQKIVILARLRPCLEYPLKEIRITEGFIYSAQEQSIHGFKVHGGVDFEAPTGTQVFAAASGYAVASYHTFKVQHDGQDKLHEAKTVYMGLGKFVIVYHPEISQDVGIPIYTEYAHLSEIVSEIPFHHPRKSSLGYIPVGHKIAPDTLIHSKHAIEVKVGEEIGRVGNSGLGWGTIDYPNNSNHMSWDETHLHFGVFTRNKSRTKKTYIDPYGLYSSIENYNTITPSNQKHSILWKG